MIKAKRQSLPKELQQSGNLGQAGFTLVETLIATLLITFTLTAMAELLFINQRGSFKVNNVVDANNAARIAMDRIGRDVRQARSMGDVCGTDVPCVPATIPVTYQCQGSDGFPSSRNPLYGNNGSPGVVPAPTTGWVSPWTQPTVASPWRIDSQILIAQVPIFDNLAANPNPGAAGPFGCPTEIPANAIAVGVPPANQANVETHVYRIVPDPDQVRHRNEFNLQIMKVPGYRIPGIYDPATVSTNPQTILTGIVGPMPPGVVANAAGPSSQWPAVFSFIDKTGNGTPDVPPLNSTLLPNYTGIIVNLEIKKGITSVQGRPSYLAFKQEVFMRNNALATTTGQPSNITGDANQWAGQ